MADPDATEPEEPKEPKELVTDDESSDLPDEESDYGPPFTAKSFGGSFVWARGDHYVATVLRVKEGENVVVSTQNRKDMHVMLTGGRGILEVHDGTDLDRVELLPAIAVFIDPGRNYRLVAMTEVELFTVYSPMN
jgi:mannose-6-phosphate isomerase-like protein (cupin superfamily)